MRSALPVDAMLVSLLPQNSCTVSVAAGEKDSPSTRVTTVAGAREEDRTAGAGSGGAMNCTATNGAHDKRYA